MYPLIPHDALLGMLELVGCLFTLVAAALSYVFMLR